MQNRYDDGASDAESDSDYIIKRSDYESTSADDSGTSSSGDVDASVCLCDAACRGLIGFVSRV